MSPSLVFFLTFPLWAHFPIALPEGGGLKRGQESRVSFAFGHPFEATRVDVKQPKAWLYAPSLSPAKAAPAPILLAPEALQQKGAKAWSLKLTPQTRGDHLLVVACQPIQHGRERIRDLVKLVLPVGGVQRGWDRSLRLELEVVPLTRPYGIAVGSSFRFSVQAGGKPLPGAFVEVERLNPEPPKALPPEIEITRVEKTDALGNAAATLDHAGWWILAVTGLAREGVRPRASLWVYVGSR